MLILFSQKLTSTSSCRYTETASLMHATITPKLHMLEDHVIPFLTKWGVGLGFLGEHGAESIHAACDETS